ncbi:PTS system protein [Klebsiella pneumoniae subsp. ozaenae]|uniref:PTS system protein n=1 Tax=Klebsiella pneumoniae subsp. ozaenae TaxID=574 RepID=A0A378B114_KLEPO|nr:PTS system protein [Klebsiella pneumoniae subsp. ozaenae]
MNQEPCYDGENSTKKSPYGNFSSSWEKTFMLPVALLSFCGIMLGIGSSLSSHDVLTLLPWLDMPLLQAIFIWMRQGRLLCLQLPAGHVLYRHPAGSGAREQKASPPSPASLAYAVMNLAVNFWLTAKGILPTTDAAILKANNNPEHYRHSVNRYRDPRGGDRRNYRLAAA